jgi:hypothetical protein
VRAPRFLATNGARAAWILRARVSDRGPPRADRRATSRRAHPRAAVAPRPAALTPRPSASADTKNTNAFKAVVSVELEACAAQAAEAGALATSCTADPALKMPVRAGAAVTRRMRCSNSAREMRLLGLCLRCADAVFHSACALFTLLRRCVCSVFTLRVRCALSGSAITTARATPHPLSATERCGCNNAEDVRETQATRGCVGASAVRARAACVAFRRLYDIFKTRPNSVLGHRDLTASFPGAPINTSYIHNTHTRFIGVIHLDVVCTTVVWRVATNTGAN